MKTIFFFAFFFCLPSLLFPQQDLSKTAFNGVGLHKADVQPFKTSIVYEDSAGGSYINLIIKLQPNGNFLTDNEAGLKGASLLAYLNLSSEEEEYLTAFINYRAARRALDK